MAKKGQKTIVPQDEVDTRLASVKEIDAKLDGLKGTHAQRQKEAAAVVDSVLVNWTPNPQVDPDVSGPELLRQAQLAVDYVKAVREELVDLQYALARGGAADDSDVLKEQREELVNEIKGFVMAFGLDMPEIPKRSGGGRPRGSTNGSSDPKVKGQWYVVLGGQRKDMSTKQNSFSSVAWYHGHKLLGTGGAIGSVKVADLEQVTGKPDMSKAWDAEFENGSSVHYEPLSD